MPCHPDRVRRNYDEAPVWRRPSENAAERLEMGVVTADVPALPPGCPMCRSSAECVSFGTACQALTR